MHVYLAAAYPQCRSTTMVVTNQDDAINCGSIPVGGRIVR